MVPLNSRAVRAIFFKADYFITVGIFFFGAGRKIKISYDSHTFFERKMFLHRDKIPFNLL